MAAGIIVRITCILIFARSICHGVTGSDLIESLSAFGDAIQSYAEKAGDSWQWGRDAFVDKVRGWSESSQEVISKMQNSAMSMLNRQQRRMISAFPHMKSTESTKYSKIMETVREMLRRRQ